jgi:hypothetical protein
MGKKIFTNSVLMLKTGVSCALGAAVYCKCSDRVVWFFFFLLNKIITIESVVQRIFSLFPWSLERFMDIFHKLKRVLLDQYIHYKEQKTWIDAAVFAYSLIYNYKIFLLFKLPCKTEVKFRGKNNLDSCWLKYTTKCQV